MLKKIIFFLLAVNLLVACGGNNAPAPTANRAGNTPVGVPTAPLTPPGLPLGGFPLLDTPLAGQIVYSNGDGDIYVIEPKPNAKASVVLKAPNDKGFLQEPQWSADGQRIVYTYLLPFDTSGLPAADLLFANADGSNPQPLLNHQLSGELFAMPTYSPDGRYVYYSHTTPIFKDKQIISATVTLERFELLTKQTQVIANDGSQPTISPDGKRLAFIHTNPDTFEQRLLTADADGKHVQVVVSGNTSSMGIGLNSPRWSRDGQRILFAIPNLFSYNRPTNQLNSLLVGWFDRLFDVQVAEAHGPPWDFWIVDADGKNMQRLTQIGEDEPQAAFAPDGKYFTFMGVAGLYIVDASGRNVRWLSREGGRGRVDWKK